MNFYKKTIVTLLPMIILLVLMGACSNAENKPETAQEQNSVFTTEQNTESYDTATESEIETEPVFLTTEQNTESYDTVIESEIETEPVLPSNGSDVDLYKEQIQEIIDINSEPAAGYRGHCWLPSGGAILFLVTNITVDNQDYDITWGCFLDIEQGQLAVSDFLTPSKNDNRIPIFRNEDAPNTQHITKSESELEEYHSFFLWHHGQFGNDAVIFVTPEINMQNQNMKYEDSPFYQVFPYDSLGTEYVELEHPGWLNDCPGWVFVIPEDEITEDYELKYMDYVLTGADLKNNTWSMRTGKCSD